MPRAQKKEQKVRDPNQPKRPLGSYILFFKDKRVEIQAAHPDWGTTEIGKFAGALWRRLTQQEKQKYEDLAARDKERYLEAMRARAPGRQGASSHQQNDPKPRLSYGSNRPKRPLSAFIWFAGDHRKELQSAHPEWGVTEVGKAAGAMWKELSDEDRKMYEDKAAWDKNRYEEMKAFEAASVSNAASVLVKPELVMKPEPVVKSEPDLKQESIVKPERDVKVDLGVKPEPVVKPEPGVKAEA